MTFAAYLRQLRKARGVRLTELASRIGVTIAYLSDIERRPNKRPPTLARVREIAAVLRLSDDELARLLRLATQERLSPELRDKVTVKIDVDRGERPAGARISTSGEFALLPLLASVPAGNPRDVHDEVIEERPVPREAAREGRYLLRVDGRSMAPLLEDGDIVMVDAAVSPTNRGIVAARIASGQEDQSTIKQLFWRPDRVMLHPLNPEFDDTILLRTGEQDETGAELFDYDGRRVRLFLKGVVVAIVWRELEKR